MRVSLVDPANIDPAIIADAAAIIRAGGLVAFPTETVYGLGADATNAAAVQGIFTAKGRPSYNPLIVHVPDASVAQTIVDDWPDVARRLTTRFWPGPLTIVLPKRDIIPDIVSAGLSTVAVRAPAHPVAQALLKAGGRPLAAPSANPSMRLSPTDGRHVAIALHDASGLLLDAGPVTVGIESTVLDLSADAPTILRPGMISRGELSSLIGDVRVATDGPSGAAKPSPGMMDRHYSPRARLVITPSAHETAIEHALMHATKAGRRIALLTRSEFNSPSADIIRMPEMPDAYARMLFATLHRLDETGTDIVVVQAVPDTEAWDGIRDRLRRAATPPDA